MLSVIAALALACSSAEVPSCRPSHVVATSRTPTPGPSPPPTPTPTPTTPSGGGRANGLIGWLVDAAGHVIGFFEIRTGPGVRSCQPACLAEPTLNAVPALREIVHAFEKRISSNRGLVLVAVDEETGERLDSNRFLRVLQQGKSDPRTLKTWKANIPRP